MKPSPAVSRYIREHDYGARAEPDQIHRLPAVFSNEPQHEISDACRCRPLNEFIWNETKGRNDWIVTHRPLPGATIRALNNDGAEQR